MSGKEKVGHIIETLSGVEAAEQNKIISEVVGLIRDERIKWVADARARADELEKSIYQLNQMIDIDRPEMALKVPHPGNY